MTGCGTICVQTVRENGEVCVNSEKKDSKRRTKVINVWLDLNTAKILKDTANLANCSIDDTISVILAWQIVRKKGDKKRGKKEKAQGKK